MTNTPNSMTPARKQPDTDTYAGRFAVRLREMRLKKGLTVEELAERSGIPAPSIYNWERAASAPILTHLPKLAAGLGLKSVQKILPTE